MNDSILETMMERMGLDKDDEFFRTDAIQTINAALSTLTQVGVGPRKGFRVVDASSTWSDFIDQTEIAGIVGVEIFTLDLVQDFVYFRMKLVFDTPTAGVADIYSKLADEALWRCKTKIEQPDQ